MRHSIWYNLFMLLLALSLFLAMFVFWAAQKNEPHHIKYGMSFNTFYAEDLGLDWKQTYDAILDDLGVRRLRLAAHWPMVEPQDDVYDFSKLDYQINRAEEVGAEVILGVGRRLPRWPECHVPAWAKELTWEEQQEQILVYMDIVVRRYQDRDHIIYWQVENEPFLEIFAHEHCGDTDEVFFEKQIDHMRALDPDRPLLVTDSGNLGTWYQAYTYGDAFGTSVYIHFWNPELGQFRTVLPPWFYRVKETVMELWFGEKPSFLIELSAEPWLLEPITDVALDVQYSRMDIEKLNDIIAYAKETRYEVQYLWGAEWWYWLKEQDHPEMWERGQKLFNQP